MEKHGNQNRKQTRGNTKTQKQPTNRGTTTITKQQI